MTSPAPATTVPDKPGYATTEFWIAGVAPLIIALLALFNVGHVDLTKDPTAQAIIKIGSFIASAIGAAFYAHSRGHMKAGAVVAVALKQMDIGAWLGQGLKDLGVGISQSKPAALVGTEIPGVLVASEPPLFTEDQLLQIVDTISPTLKTHVEHALDAFKEALATQPPVTMIPTGDTGENSGNFKAPSFS